MPEAVWQQMSCSSFVFWFLYLLSFMYSQLPFIVRYNGDPAYHIEGKTWTIRSVDCSAKVSSGAMWSLMQPKLTGAHLELTGTAGCCRIPGDSYKDTEASLQCVCCCVPQEGPLAGTHHRT